MSSTTTWWLQGLLCHWRSYIMLSGKRLADGQCHVWAALYCILLASLSAPQVGDMSSRTRDGPLKLWFLRWAELINVSEMYSIVSPHQLLCVEFKFLGRPELRPITILFLFDLFRMVIQTPIQIVHLSQGHWIMKVIQTFIKGSHSYCIDLDR